MALESHCWRTWNVRSPCTSAGLRLRVASVRIGRPAESRNRTAPVARETRTRSVAVLTVTASGVVATDHVAPPQRFGAATSDARSKNARSGAYAIRMTSSVQTSTFSVAPGSATSTPSATFSAVPCAEVDGAKKRASRNVKKAVRCMGAPILPQ